MGLANDIKAFIWWLPSWVHELILNLTGYRLVEYHENIPDWLLFDHWLSPIYIDLWDKTLRKRYLVWTKQWPL